MLQLFTSIKNVGRFRNSAAIPNPRLARHTFAFAPNGYGKTTLCAILRSIQSGDVRPLAGRRTLGPGAGPQEIDLLFTGGNRRMRNGAWSALEPRISIFDGVFVSENVHSGDDIGIDHRRGLYRVIVGQEGAELAQQEETLAEQARAKQGEVTRALQSVEAISRPTMSAEEFLALAENGNIDADIIRQVQQTQAIRNAGFVRVRPPLAQLTEPMIGIDLTALLSQTLEAIGENVEQTLAEHMGRHQMPDPQWLAHGLEFLADDSCPFCGRNEVENLQLVRAYRTLFSDQYRGLQTAIREARQLVQAQVGAVAQGRLAQMYANNNANREWWAQYVQVGPERFPALDAMLQALQNAAPQLDAVLEQKDRAPLNPIENDQRLLSSLASIGRANELIAAYNGVVAEINADIAATKAQAAGGDIVLAELNQARLAACKRRHGQEGRELCDAYTRLFGEKAEIEAQKVDVRRRLDEHTANVIRPYEQRINYFLDRFNANFRIEEVGHAYPGGKAASVYRLRINDTMIDLGDARTPTDTPSFKNTLSAGDRSTLALAFFLAGLERIPDLGQRVVVFDDPFNSQDAFRRRHTLYEIKRIAGLCEQVIVLSHDAYFLKLLWEKCSPDTRVSIQLEFHPNYGSKIREFDLENACRGRAQKELDDLHAFRATGAGDPREVIKKLRIVLETHMRTTYSGSFLPDDNLGIILRKIREGGVDHPAHAYYAPMERVDDYTNDYHHGEDARGREEPPLDRDELSGFVNDTLKIVNALPS